MKLVALFIFIGSMSFGQMTLEELIAVSKMDKQSFKNYAINNGFVDQKVSFEGRNSTISFEKEVEGFQTVLSHYTKRWSASYVGGYKTNNANELSLWEQQINRYGFYLKETIDLKEKTKIVYEKPHKKIILFLTQEGFEIYVEEFKY